MELRFPGARRRPRIPVPLPTLTCNTAVLFVDRKNYRLQDIQLSKTAARLPARHPPDETGRKTVVENTGLEPVTSWLQTRRSPS